MKSLRRHECHARNGIGLALVDYILYYVGLEFFPLRAASRYALTLSAVGLFLGFFLAVAEHLGLLSPSVSSVVSEVSTIGAKLAKLEAQLSALAKQFEGRKTGYASAIRPELERITTAFFQSETFTRLEDEIGKKYDSGVDLGVNVRELKSVFNRSINELAEQLIKQRVNSNLNLLLGLVFATLGIAVLGYVFYATYFSGTHAAEVADLRSFFVGFIPRIMFVILVESVPSSFLACTGKIEG
ncbi:MAG: hypothetical protein QOF41_2022 [Methylobacteriaceae bacterium]|nr:hypothetical protein [Methylobacteriaceae bacterium]